MQPFSLLIKPAGSDCNINCSYCFYKNRAPQIGQGRQRMNDQVLEKMVKDYMQLGFEDCSFAWQGGEPTLMGLDFYKKAVEFQTKYSKGQTVGNALQTNAIVLDKKWCQFLRENKFLVGVSIDGPKKYHDYFRKDYSTTGTFDRVMRAIKNMTACDVEFNTLSLVNNVTADHPDEILDFLLTLGHKYIQFIPCVETDPNTGEIADFSATPKQYGDFLCRIFDRWCQIGYENLSVRDFDSILSYYLNGNHSICTFSRLCTGYIVVEHKGDCYPCDFFVTPDLYLGNIFETPIGEIAQCKKKREFNRAKKTFPSKCLVCRHLNICRGGCQKDRLLKENDQRKQSYFCQSYTQFFDYALPKFAELAANINAKQTKRNF